METSNLKAHPFGNRYPEWMPNLPLNRGQDSNPLALGSLYTMVVRLGYICLPCVKEIHFLI